MYPSLQDYISRLQEVAMNLTEKNRKLRKKHAQLGEKVAALMSVDLVRQRDKWKEGVKELRAVFDGLEKQGIAVTRDWKVHWDNQVSSRWAAFLYVTGWTKSSE
jgi:dynein heavy chain 2